MKNSQKFRNMKAFCLAIGLLIGFSAKAEVPAFDNDKPATSYTTAYSQVFNTWDGTTFYNQWDMVDTQFGASDVALGYLKLAWVEKRILRSKATYSSPYIFSTVLDWSEWTNFGGVTIRAKSTGNIEALQEPADADPGYNREGITFYPSADGQNMIVQFSGVDNGYGATAVTRINVPKPTSVTSLLNDKGIIRIEDFGSTIYVYYRGARYIRIDLGNLTAGVYTSGTVYNSDMTSVGTFTGMEVEAIGKVAISCRVAYMRIYSAEIQTAVWNSVPATTFNTLYSQTFNTWDNTTFYNQWDMVDSQSPFTSADIASGYLQFEWLPKRILRSKTTYNPPYIFSASIALDLSVWTNLGGLVIRAKADGNIEALEEPGGPSYSFNREGIAFYPSADGQNMIVQFSGVDNGYGSTTINAFNVPKPAGISSLLDDQGTIRIEDYGTSIYVFYRGVRYIRIDLGGLTGNIYTSGTVYKSDMTVVGSFTGMEIEAVGKVAVAQRAAALRLYSADIQTQIPGIPTNVVATKGNAQASVSFSAPANIGGSAIIGYTVTSSPGGFTATGASSPITVTGLTNGTAYTFTVTARNSTGSSFASAASAAVTPSTTPGAPTSVVSTAGNLQLSIAFVAPANNGGAAITNYEYSTNGGTNWTVRSPAATTSPIVITGLTNGTAYSVKIRAVNAEGAGTASALATGTLTPRTTPGAPTSVVSTAGNAQLSIAFVAPASNGGAAISNYQYSTDGGTNWTVRSPAATTSPIVIIGLTNGTTYSVKIKAVNAAGAGTASTLATGSLTPYTVPGIPTSVVATAGNAKSSIAFTTPASNGGSAIIDYTVTSNPGNLTATGTSSPLTVNGLTNGTAYTFTVTARNAAGSSAVSGASGAVTPHAVNNNIVVNSATNITALTLTPVSDVVVSSNKLTINASTTVNSITVAPGAQLELTSGNTLTAGTVTLQSDATGTATLVDNTTNAPQAITATVQQYVEAGRNWYMSIPLASGASSLLNRGTSVVCYDEPSGTWIAPAANTLNKLRGYVQVATSTPSVTGTTGTVDFTGVVNTGVHSISLSRTAGKTGFNLVGNPYPSYLDWNLVTKTNVSNTMWFRTKEGGVYKFYTYVANSGAGVGSPASVTNKIPPMQAFWVRVNTEGAGSVAVDNNMRSHKDVAGNIMKAPSQTPQQLLRLQVSNGTNTDETVLYFNANASDGFDQYDAQKRSNEDPTIPEIFTQVGSEQLVINGMKEIKYNTEIPIGFSTLTAISNNSLSISANEMTNFESGTRVILIDNQNPGVENDLTKGEVYNFSAPVTAPTTNRFSLLFRAPGVATDVDNSTKFNSQIFVNAANQITIIAPEKSKYAIYNAVGQQIENGTLNSELRTQNSKLAAGVYVVKVNNESTRVVVK